jgi:hypothetical protein
MWLLGVEFFMTSDHSSMTSDHSSRSRLLSPCSLQPKDLFIIIHKYTVADFRHTRRRCPISLPMVVVSHHVVAGIWTQDLWKNSQCSYLLNHLSNPFPSVLSRVSIVKTQWPKINPRRKGLLGLHVHTISHHRRTPGQQVRQRRNLESGADAPLDHGGHTAYWLASHGLLSLLSYRTQSHQHRDGTTHNRLDPPCSSQIRKMLFRLAYRSIIGGIFSIEVSCPQMTRLWSSWQISNQYTFLSPLQCTRYMFPLQMTISHQLLVFWDHGNSSALSVWTRGFQTYIKLVMRSVGLFLVEDWVGEARFQETSPCWSSWRTVVQRKGWAVWSPETLLQHRFLPVHSLVFNLTPKFSTESKLILILVHIYKRQGVFLGLGI